MSESERERERPTCSLISCCAAIMICSRGGGTMYLCRGSGVGVGLLRQCSCARFCSGSGEEAGKEGVRYRLKRKLQFQAAAGGGVELPAVALTGEQQ